MGLSSAEALLPSAIATRFRKDSPPSRVEQIKQRFQEREDQRREVEGQIGYATFEAELDRLRWDAPPGDKFSVATYVNEEGLVGRVSATRADGSVISGVTSRVTEEQAVSNYRDSFAKTTLMDSKAVADYSSLEMLAKTFNRDDYMGIMQKFGESLQRRLGDGLLHRGETKITDPKEQIWAENWVNLIKKGLHTKAYELSESSIPADFDPDAPEQSLGEIISGLDKGRIATGVVRGLGTALAKSLDPRRFVDRARTTFDFVKHPVGHTKEAIDKIWQNPSVREHIKDPYAIAAFFGTEAVVGFSAWFGGTAGSSVASGVTAISAAALSGGMAWNNRRQERSVLKQLVSGETDQLEAWRKAMFEIAADHPTANTRVQRALAGVAAAQAVNGIILGGVSVEQKIQHGVLGLVDANFGPNAFERLGKKIAEETGEVVQATPGTINRGIESLQTGTVAAQEFIGNVAKAPETVAQTLSAANDNVVDTLHKTSSDIQSKFKLPAFLRHPEPVSSHAVGSDPGDLGGGGDVVPPASSDGGGAAPGSGGLPPASEGPPAAVAQLAGGSGLLNSQETSEAAQRVAKNISDFALKQPEFQDMMARTVGQNKDLVENAVNQSLATAGIDLQALPEDERNRVIAETRSQITSQMEQMADKDFVTAVNNTLSNLEKTDPALFNELNNKKPEEVAQLIRDTMEGTRTPYTEVLDTAQADLSRVYQEGAKDSTLISNLATSTQGFLDEYGRYPGALETGTKVIDPRFGHALEALVAQTDPKVRPFMEQLSNKLQSDPDFQSLFQRSTIGTDVDVASQIAYKTLDSAGLSVGQVNAISPDAYNQLLAEIRASMVPYQTESFKNALDNFLAHTDEATKNKILSMTPEQFNNQLQEALNNPDAKNDLSPIVADVHSLNDASWKNPQVRNGLVDFANSKLEQLKAHSSIGVPDHGVEVSTAAAESATGPGITMVSEGDDIIRPEDTKSKLDEFLNAHQEVGELKKIAPGSTVGQMLVDKGYDVKWNSSDSEVFGAHIAANFDMLKEFLEKSDSGKPFPVNLEDLSDTIESAEDGDEEARRKLVEALSKVPSGGNFRLINPDALPQTLDVIGVKPHATV